MAKTIWVDNSILQPVFMDIFFGNTAITGHIHDGGNDDGKAPLIQPARDFHTTINNLTPNVNLQTEKTESIDVSFDGASTFPFTTSVALKRVGDIVFCRIISVITGIMTSNGAIFFQTTGGGSLDTAFWPSATTNSSLGTGLNDQLVTNTRVPNSMSRFDSVNMDIRIYNGESIGTATDFKGTVTIQAGTVYSWLL